jgi:hypothetical protein
MTMQASYPNGIEYLDDLAFSRYNTISILEDAYRLYPA